MPQIQVPKEQRWPHVILTPISINGVIITVSDTYNLRAKQLIQLQQTGLEPFPCEIVTVFNKTEILVKSIQTSDKTRPMLEPEFKAAIAPYNSGTLVALEQKRNSIDPAFINRAVYAEEPTMALRSHLVDYWGRPWTTDNPFPVQLSDGSISIGTVEANLEVHLTHLDDSPEPGRIHDSVRIGDGTNLMNVHPDGSVDARNHSQLVPEPHDDIVITRDPVTFVITQAEYKLGGSTVATVAFERDASLNLTRAYRL